MTVMPSTENYNYGLRNMTLTSTMAIPPSMSIDKLFPALLECFGIILCGYIAGRANMITSSQAKGLGNFVSKFALPALLFKNMVLLDFANVIWSFLWSILIAKVTVFVIVCVLTLLVASPDSRLSKAGLFSIFATQSNDFALGYPIVDALYGNTYPEYLQYIYLVAPISLMILNPIGFVFCEIQKWKENRTPQQSKLRIIGMVLLQVLKNPIVFMVIVGISMHFILGQKIPAIIEQFVDGLGNSFGGSALFYLGLTMVGQIRKLTKSTFVSLILLITAKLLVMPLICREMVELLDRNSSTGNHTSLSNYAFLYGVFPTAPSVAIYASQYNMELEIVTSGMVISTFVSAPIMYVSAWLLTIPWMDSQLLLSALQNASFDISIITLFALVWSVAVMILSKKFKRLPHLFTTNLLLAQFLVCVGMILWKFIINQNNFIGQILSFILLYSSLYSTYLWTGLIALSLLLLRKDDEPKIRMAAFIIAGWGIPAFIVGMLLIAGHKNEETLDSAFFYGKPQIMSTAVVLLCSIVVAGVSLMFLSRSYQDSNYQVLDQTSLPGTSEDLRPLDNQESPQLRGTMLSPQLEASIQEDSCPCGLSNGKMCCSSAPVPDMIACGSRRDAPNGQAGQCARNCESQSCLLVLEEQKLHNTDRQLARHVLLCLLLIVGLFANLSSCLWWLFNQEPGQLYVELQFFCAIFNYGQGFITFGIFGLDKHLIIVPFKKRIAGLFMGKEKVDENESAVSEEIRMTCRQFVRYHKDQCVRDIVQQRSSAAATFTEQVGESFL
ncbi:integral membrane protein GPR155 isoform X3 [Erpetoichthys calabaricus]|uniref:integral membrane protein GPR155 isoform X3 n=1 Tax=Erpetoichthys calabaricus TaxID=27687 RepID=UPI0022349DF9|nr:integral membrane protein GPR155 isoform X3 [Erpetoichthys calabaricus]